MNNEEKKNIEIVKFDTPYYTDAISRQAAIDAMREKSCGCCWDAKDILAHLPSVSTEKTGLIEKSNFDEKQYRFDLVCAYECGRNSVTEKTGRWIRHDNGKYHWYLCSCCDAMAGSDEKMMAYKFCPNCGAKMEVEE